MDEGHLAVRAGGTTWPQHSAGLLHFAFVSQVQTALGVLDLEGGPLFNGQHCSLMAVVGVCAVPGVASSGWSGSGAGGATADREAVFRLGQKPGAGGAGQGTGVLLARPVAAEHGFRGTRTALTLCRLCAILAIPVEPALACWAGTLVAARCVDAAEAATSPIDAALIHVPTVGDTIEQIAMMAEALEASRRVDTYVITGSIKGTLVYILAVPLIDEQLITLLAAALKAAHCVAANVVTAPVVQAALVYVFTGLPVWLQHEAHGAAAVDARGCVVALAVTAPVVDSTGLCVGGRRGTVTRLWAWRSPDL